MFFYRLLKLPKLNTVPVLKSVRQFSNLHIRKTSPHSQISLPLIEKISNIYNPWIYHQNSNLNLPQIHILKIDLPNGIKSILPKIEPTTRDAIEAPALDNSIEKEAVKMIVIRRKKMKKHKLKKLRKKMKFEWAKRRQRRELKKEKLFQAGLIQQCKVAELFSAEKYIEEKINKFKEASQLISQESSTAHTSFERKLI